MPIDAVAESTISIGHRPSSALAATCADCIVAERCADRFTHTIPSAPSSCSARNVSSNAPTDGAEVSGSTGDDPSWRQNSSEVSSLRSTYSRSPKRMVRGTTSMPSSSHSSGGRSQALSVTTRTAMAPPRFRVVPIRANDPWLHAGAELSVRTSRPGCHAAWICRQSSAVGVRRLSTATSDPSSGVRSAASVTT